MIFVQFEKVFEMFAGKINGSKPSLKIFEASQQRATKKKGERAQERQRERENKDDADYNI